MRWRATNAAAHSACTLASGSTPLHERPARDLGLSATQGRSARSPRLLVGERPGHSDPEGRPACTIVDIGHRRALDFEIFVPGTELEAVASTEQMGRAARQIAEARAASAAPPWCSSTRAGWPSGGASAGGALGDGRSPLTTAASPKDRRQRIEEPSAQRASCGWWWRRRRSSSASTSVPSSWCVRLGSPRNIATLAAARGSLGPHAFRDDRPGASIPLTRDELVEMRGAAARGTARSKLGRDPPCRAAPLDMLAQQMVASARASRGRERAVRAVRGARCRTGLTRAAISTRWSTLRLRGRIDRARSTRRVSAPRSRDGVACEVGAARGWPR